MWCAFALLGISLLVPETPSATVLPRQRSYETYFSMSFVNCLSKEKLVYGIQKKNHPSPVLTERKEKNKFSNVSVATCILHFIYSEFQGRQGVLPESWGGTLQSHWARPAGKASQTENLGLMVQASMPSAMTLYRISGHPLLTELGQGQRELTVAFHICCLWFCAFFEACPLGWGEWEEEAWNHLGLSSSHAAPIFTFKLLLKNIMGTSLLSLRQHWCKQRYHYITLRKNEYFVPLLWTQLQWLMKSNSRIRGVFH